jgi:hypothetical protein
MDVVGRLLACGCDLHLRNSKGWCAVHSAASNGYFEVVLRLVQVGGEGPRLRGGQGSGASFQGRLNVWCGP